MTPVPSASDARRTADKALFDLAALIAQAKRPVPDLKALRALLSGIAATPPGTDHAWMDLVTIPPRAPDLVQGLSAARAALAPPPLDTRRETTAGRLSALRQMLTEQGLAGLMVPRADAHQGEFVAANAERLAWLSGFTGSAGTAVVLADRAALFVDGRYTLQARAQLDPALWTVVPVATTPVRDWLVGALKRGDRLGYDPWLHPVAEVDRRAAACERARARLVPVTVNPIDTLWQDRPPSPLGPVVPHPTALAGRSSEDKRSEIAAILREERAHAVVITDPSALAWLLNIRGADVPFTPLALGFAILFSDGQMDLFMDRRKLTPAAEAHLEPACRVQPPSALGAALDALGGRERVVILDRDVCAQWIRARLVDAGARVRFRPDPVALPRARKTPAELAGTRAAHRRDGAALTRFLCWLDREGPAGTLTERSAATYLESLRAEGDQFRGLSFETISAAGPNGAIVHYRVTAETDRRLAPDMLYLVDSGGQYRDGTTDVTRTVAIGTPTPEQVRRFTQVLKGHIAIATAVFPVGTTGTHLDALARLALWADGVDYDHGTGHGVGSYLGVHEGPHRLSRRPSEVAFEVGMILSNEPGFYKPESFGIRIENLVAVESRPAPEGATVPLLGFETLTLAPIDRRLIDPALLTETERAWLDGYHARVRETLSPLVDDDTRAWLEPVTRPLHPA